MTFNFCGNYGYVSLSLHFQWVSKNGNDAAKPSDNSVQYIRSASFLSGSSCGGGADFLPRAATYTMHSGSRPTETGCDSLSAVPGAVE